MAAAAQVQDRTQGGGTAEFAAGCEGGQQRSQTALLLVTPAPSKHRRMHTQTQYTTARHTSRGHAQPTQK